MLENLLDNEEICAAPAVDDLVPNTLEKLEEYLELHPDNKDAWFLFANLLLQNSKLQEAEDAYNHVLQEDPSNAFARCNLAITLRARGRSSTAEKELKKVILKEPELILAHLNLALIDLEKGDDKSAVLSLNNVLRIDSNEIRAHLTLSKMAKDKGKMEDCRKHAEIALEIDPENSNAHALVGYLEFIKGKELYESGNLLDAFKSWSATMKAHPVAFSASPDVVREKQALEKTFREGELLSDATNLFSEGIEKKEIEQRDYYDLFTLFFFSVGLIPEVFEEPEHLQERFQTWKERFSSVPSYPYAKFRLGVIYCYCGLLDDAFEFFTACRDEIPATKSESLKLTDVIAFTQKMRRASRPSEEQSSEAAEGDWSVFEDSFQRKAWQRSGLPPQKAIEWFENEISPQQAKHWDKANITAEEAKDWTSRGFIIAKDALKMRNAGFSAEQADNWIKNFPHPPELALQCRSVGFTDPKEAAEWLRVLMFPSEAWQWKELGFAPADVVLYRSDGISDPHLASKERAKKSH